MDGTSIILTRGDTLRLKVVILNKKEDGTTEEYEPQQGDTIHFNMKKNYLSRDILIHKEFSALSPTLEILPEDTKSLEFGSYCYDMEIHTNDGDIFTFIKKALFRVDEEVG